MGLVTVALILALLGLEAVNQGAARQRNAQIIAARQLADAASQSGIGIERVSLAAAANALPDAPLEARQALLDAVNTVAPSQVYIGDDGLSFIGALAIGTEGHVYMGGEGGTIIAYGPDGKTATRFGPIEQPAAFQGVSRGAEWDEFDLAQDAHLVSTLENDRTVWVWELASGALTGTITFATPPIATEVARHVPIAASRLNESVVIWDVQTQRILCTVVQPRIAQFALSPDARILLLDSPNVDDPVMQYDAQTCARQKSHSLDTDTLDYSISNLFIMDDNNTVYGQAFVTDQQTSESKAYSLARWTLDDSVLTPILEEYADVDYLLLNDVSADGRRALLDSGEAVFVVDTAQGRPLMQIGTGSPLARAAFSADGTQLFITVSDWRVAEPEAEELMLGLFNIRHTAVFAFDIDRFSEPMTRLETAEQLLLSADAARAARINGTRADIIDVASDQTITTLRGHLNPIRLMAFSPDGQWLASSDGSEEHFIWSIPSGELRHQLVMDGYSGVKTLLFSPNSRRLFIAGDEKQITNGDASVWEVEQGTKITEFDTFELNAVEQAIWFDDATIGFVDTPNRTLRFLRVAQADDTLEANFGGEDTALIDVAADGRFVRVDSHIFVYRVTLDTLLDRLDGTLVQVSNQLPADYGPPQGVHIEADHAIVSYPRALVVMPLLTRAADTLLDPVNSDPLRQVFSTWSDVQAWRFTSDGVLALYPDGTLERWRIPVGYAAAQQFLQERRFILPLTCVQQREAGLTESCATLDDNYHRFALNVPPMPDATPIQIARAELPTPTYIPTATFVFDDETSAAVQMARDIAEEDLPFSIPTVPTLEGFVPDFYFISQGDECIGGDLLTRPIIAPGETCLEIGYQYDDEAGALALILTASESPFATLEEWHTSSQMARYSFQLYRTDEGLLFARTATATVSAAAVIDAGIYYSIMPLSADTLTDREYFTLISQLADVPLGDLDRAELVTQALALEMPLMTATPRAFTLADLDFTAQAPSQVAEFALNSQRVIDNKATNAIGMALLGITSEASLELVYRDGTEVIMIRQQRLLYPSLEAWRDAVDVVRSGTLTDMNGTAVLLMQAEASGLVAHVIQEGVLVSFSTQLPRSTLFAFIETWLALP